MILLIRKLTVAAIALLLLLAVAAIAENGSSLDQDVPFGITVSEGGQYIPVFDEIGSKNKIGLLMPGQLCALDYAEIESVYYWYHIVYLNEDGEAHAGYVKENNFEQLTLSRLLEMAKDPEASGLIDQYLELSETSPLFIGKNKTSKAAGQHYVLNTNTMKFHYPDCVSVSQIKEKNRKDYTGDRENLIEVGYTPCKNCNP